MAKQYIPTSIHRTAAAAATTAAMGNTVIRDSAHRLYTIRRRFVTASRSIQAAASITAAAVIPHVRMDRSAEAAFASTPQNPSLRAMENLSIHIRILSIAADVIGSVPEIQSAAPDSVFPMR